MKIDKTKLYVGMSLEERAKLAFKHMNSDNETFSSILATIPKKTYSGNDLGFSMRTTGLHHTAILWGFEYQKEQGLNTSYLGVLSAIDECTNDPELKQARINAGLKYQHSCDRLEILFSLLDELDKSHGLDTNTVYGLAEVRCIAVGNNILNVDGYLPMRTPQVINNPTTKDKNQACKDHYQETRTLLLTQLNQYQVAIGDRTDSDLETENEELRRRIKSLH